MADAKGRLAKVQANVDNAAVADKSDIPTKQQEYDDAVSNLQTAQADLQSARDALNAITNDASTVFALQQDSAGADIFGASGDVTLDDREKFEQLRADMILTSLTVCTAER